MGRHVIILLAFKRGKKNLQKKHQKANLCDQLDSSHGELAVDLTGAER